VLRQLHVALVCPRATRYPWVQQYPFGSKFAGSLVVVRRWLAWRVLLSVAHVHAMRRAFTAASCAVRVALVRVSVANVSLSVFVADARFANAAVWLLSLAARSASLRSVSLSFTLAQYCANPVVSAVRTDWRYSLNSLEK